MVCWNEKCVLVILLCRTVKDRVKIQKPRRNISIPECLLRFIILKRPLLNSSKKVVYSEAGKEDRNENQLYGDNNSCTGVEKASLTEKSKD